MLNVNSFEDLISPLINENWSQRNILDAVGDSSVMCLEGWGNIVWKSRLEGQAVSSWQNLIALAHHFAEAGTIFIDLKNRKAENIIA